MTAFFAAKWQFCRVMNSGRGFKPSSIEVCFAKSQVSLLHRTASERKWRRKEFITRYFCQNGANNLYIHPECQKPRRHGCDGGALSGRHDCGGALPKRVRVCAIGRYAGAGSEAGRSIAGGRFLRVCDPQTSLRVANGRAARSQALRPRCCASEATAGVALPGVTSLGGALPGVTPVRPP